MAANNLCPFETCVMKHEGDRATHLFADCLVFGSSSRHTLRRCQLEETQLPRRPERYPVGPAGTIVRVWTPTSLPKKKLACGSRAQKKTTTTAVGAVLLVVKPDGVFAVGFAAQVSARSVPVWVAVHIMVDATHWRSFALANLNALPLGFRTQQCFIRLPELDVSGANATVRVFIAGTASSAEAALALPGPRE
jgi:hypothetical protein